MVEKSKSTSKHKKLRKILFLSRCYCLLFGVQLHRALHSVRLQAIPNFLFSTLHTPLLSFLLGDQCPAPSEFLQISLCQKKKSQVNQMCHFQIGPCCKQITDAELNISNISNDTFVQGYRLSKLMNAATKVDTKMSQIILKAKQELK